MLGIAALLAVAGCRSETVPPSPGSPSGANPSATIALSSPALAYGDSIPPKYTADGEDVSPPLTWSGLPAGTKQLALICEDPDAPDPANPGPDPWVHWVIYRIPASASGLPEAIPRKAQPEQPSGIVQGNNSWASGKNVGYRGPSPPIGEHRYFFRLYALDAELDLQPGLDKTALLRAIEGHVLAEGELMGTYAR